MNNLILKNKIFIDRNKNNYKKKSNKYQKYKKAIKVKIKSNVIR